MLTLGHIVAALLNYEIDGTEPSISSVTIDSRTVTPGSLFVAFDGEQVDGHDYVAKAIASGAIAAIVERPVDDFTLVEADSDVAKLGDTPFLIRVANSEKALQTVARYWRQRHPIRVIGVTGSVGKTSTKECIYTVLSEQYRTLKSEKNFNTEIGLPLQLLNLRPEHERAVMEMGMYVRGDIALLASVATPEVGVVTNVGEVHVERAGSQEAIALGKRELVEALPADGVAILNNDDALVAAMHGHTAARVLTYGLTPDADISADNVKTYGFDGISFDLSYAGQTSAVRSSMRGIHNVYTALSAAAVGFVEGMSMEAVVRGLEKHEDTLRLQLRPGINDSVILDDAYNSNPQSAEAALKLLADADRRRVAVLGDMLELGSHEAVGHAHIGQVAATTSDLVVAIGARGRLIGEAAITAGLSEEHVFFAADSTAAVPVVMDLIRPNDTVLVKGSLGAKMKTIVDAIVRSEEVASREKRN